MTQNFYSLPTSPQDFGQSKKVDPITQEFTNASTAIITVGDGLTINGTGSFKGTSIIPFRATPPTPWLIGNLAMTGNWTTLESGGTGFTFVYGEKAVVLNTQAAQGGNRVELAGLNENAFIDNINLGISNDTNYSAHFTKTTDGNYVIFTDTYLPTQDFTTINATATQSTSKPNLITPKEFCCQVCSLTSKLSKNPAEILCSSVPEDQEKQFTGKLEGRFSSVEDFANAIKTIGEVKRVIDNTEYINESLAEILDTFKKALMLVIIIVFIFLQSWRATLIPVLAIPASPWHFWTG